MNKTVVVVGAQWGDEGKGKVVDLLGEQSDMVVRFAGGPNAGHTLVVNGKKTILRLIPSGILHSNTICVMSQGMVIDPIVLEDELNALTDAGIDFKNRLFISDAAHLIMPYHLLVDGKQEFQAVNPIGTTKKGIGPAYEDKVARRGIRLGDLKDIKRAGDLACQAKYFWKGFVPIDFSDNSEAYLHFAASVILPFLTDTSKLVNDAVKSKQNVLFEGAQGTLLDVDHGTYPYVTSSSAVAGGACTGAGVGPSKINKVIGITKAYSTRVGEGPFPTEFVGSLADQLRKAGNEYGSVTKRPRRVGWLDLQLLKYAAQVNGLDGLVVTKLDTLSELALKQITVNSVSDGRKSVAGWDEDISQIKTFSDLPLSARNYIQMIEDEVEVPVCMVSVGPDRNQTIVIQKIWD